MLTASDRPKPLSIARQLFAPLVKRGLQPRLKGKLKKGERKKAAKAAEEAKRISSVLSSVVGSSAVDRESNKDLLEQRSQSSMPTAISSSTADSGPRTTFAEHRGRRRRPKSASHSGIPTNARRGSTGRPPAPKVRRQPFRLNETRQNYASLYASHGFQAGRSFLPFYRFR